MSRRSSLYVTIAACVTGLLVSGACISAPPQAPERTVEAEPEEEEEEIQTCGGQVQWVVFIEEADECNASNPDEPDACDALDLAEMRDTFRQGFEDGGCPVFYEWPTTVPEGARVLRVTFSMRAGTFERDNTHYGIRYFLHDASNDDDSVGQGSIKVFMDQTPGELIYENGRRIAEGMPLRGRD